MKNKELEVYKKELVGKVENNRRAVDEDPAMFGMFEDIGYNQALDDVLNIISVLLGIISIGIMLLAFLGFTPLA